MTNDDYPYGKYTFADPKEFENCTDNDYDAIAAAFDDIMGYDFHAATYGIRRAHIETHVASRPFDCLDLCCGTGLFLERVAKDYNANLHGIDLSEQQLAVAYRRLLHAEGNVTLNLGDITTAKYPRHMDLVTCTMDALNHLDSSKQWQTVFKKTYEALKPGGAFLFDINLPERLLNDWNHIEYIRKKNVRYIQLAEKPKIKGDIVWRRTPMIVQMRQSDNIFKEYKTVIRQMAMPMEKVSRLLLAAGLRPLVEEHPGMEPQGHIFNKNRVFVCAIK